MNGADPTRVLFVSKAVVPPYRDGAVCLVHGLATSASRCAPTVLTTADAPPLEGVRMDAIYGAPSRYAPPIRDNMRVLAHLVADRVHELWHFVFAPNPLTSRAGRMLRTLRGKPVLQTVASQPRSYDRVARLLFGDRIVAVTRHTADRLVRGGASSSRIEVIAPPVRDLSRDEACRAAARRDAGVPIGAPLFVYPGDLEFSHGAQVVADAVPTLLSSVQDAWVVYACRAKTPGARAVQRALQQAFRGQPRVRFAGEVADLPALLASAMAVLFPVDDLYGKIDLPYAVIEAALLGVPVIVDTNGPLAEVQHAVAVGSREPRAVAEASIRLAHDDAARAQIGQAMRRAALVRHDPLRVMSAYEELYALLASGRPVA